MMDKRQRDGRGRTQNTRGQGENRGARGYDRKDYRGGEGKETARGKGKDGGFRGNGPRRTVKPAEVPEASAEITDPSESCSIEGRNAVLEAFRAGKTIDKLYVQEGLNDGPIQSVLREAKKQDTIVRFVEKERLDQLSRTGTHQGVIAMAAAFEYAEVEDILKKAEEKGEDPFLFLLDGIEDPQNLGAIIRTANLAGAHGVIIPKNRAVGLTPTVVRTSAGALAFTPVARVTNLTQTMEELKKKGLWFVCADMQGEVMYKQNLTGPIGVVIGNEGEGVSRLVKENCDFTASIPMKGDIDSLNASVAAGVLAFEVVRQRMEKGGMSAL